MKPVVTSRPWSEIFADMLYYGPVDATSTASTITMATSVDSDQYYGHHTEPILSPFEEAVRKYEDSKRNQPDLRKYFR